MHYIFIGTLIILPMPALAAIVQYLRLRRARARHTALQRVAQQQADNHDTP